MYQSRKHNKIKLYLIKKNSRCVRESKHYWPEYLEEQDLFCNEKSMKATLKMIPNNEFRRICESVFKGLVLINKF